MLIPTRRFSAANLAAHALMLALQGCGQADMSPTDLRLASVSRAADDTRQACQTFMHEDADEYVSCIDTLLTRSVAGESLPERSARELGMAYVGWVGANNSARIGLPGALRATQHYRRLFRPMQQQLGLTDAALCSAVAGDCATRIAQLHEQERAERDERVEPPSTSSSAGPL